MFCNREIRTGDLMRFGIRSREVGDGEYMVVIVLYLK